MFGWGCIMVVGGAFFAITGASAVNPERRLPGVVAGAVTMVIGALAIVMSR